MNSGALYQISQKGNDFLHSDAGGKMINDEEKYKTQQSSLRVSAQSMSNCGQYGVITGIFFFVFSAALFYNGLVVVGVLASIGCLASFWIGYNLCVLGTNQNRIADHLYRYLNISTSTEGQIYTIKLSPNDRFLSELKKNQILFDCLTDEMGRANKMDKAQKAPTTQMAPIKR